MHEIKSPFLILMEEQSYLAQSLESAFEKQNVKVKIVTIAEASSIVISEKPSGYLICTSPELLKKAVSVKVMVDQAIKNKTPVFIMGNIDELELLWETLPQQMVMDVFIRPITVGDMVDNVCTQMNDFYQLKKHTILAVDDSGIILRKIKALLEDTYQVVLANSGAMAIKYLTLNTPDLILLDYAMPIVDGSQIMQMLREDPEFHHIPIIFLTGKNDAETVKNVMSLKPDGYLLKSMNPQKLHAAIDDFLHHGANKPVTIPIAFCGGYIDILQKYFPPDRQMSHTGQLYISCTVSRNNIQFLFCAFLQSGATVVFSSEHFLSTRKNLTTCPEPVLTASASCVNNPYAAHVLSDHIATENFVLPPFYHLPASDGKTLSFSDLSPADTHRFPAAAQHRGWYASDDPHRSAVRLHWYFQTISTLYFFRSDILSRHLPAAPQMPAISIRRNHTATPRLSARFFRDPDSSPSGQQFPPRP